MDLTTGINFLEEFDIEEFKKEMEGYMGYMVMNDCYGDKTCNIDGEGGMISKFNIYVMNLKVGLLKGLDDAKKKTFNEGRTSNKINVLYEYKDGKVEEYKRGEIKQRVKSVEEITKGLLKYGILKWMHNEYYILSSSKLFTWSNVHKVNVSDVKKFLTLDEDKNIQEKKRYILVGILRLYMEGGKKDGDEDMIKKYNDVIEEFKKAGLLDLTGDKYSELYKMFIELLRCIFWVYRKSVVDSMIGDSIRKVKKPKMVGHVTHIMELNRRNKMIRASEVNAEGDAVSEDNTNKVEEKEANMECYRASTSEANIEVDAVSVGSTKILSDYDVTLYGNFRLMSEVIELFNEKMNVMYGNSSEVIFDTNVYGTSFIKLPRKTIFGNDNDSNLYDVETKACTGGEFQYMKGNSDDVIDMQHVWAFIKVLKALKMIEKFDVRIYTSLYKYMESKLTENAMKYLEEAGSFMSFLNKRRDYVKVLNSYETLKSNLLNTDPILLTNMYISLVNYYGSETYFTRGAFLDIVVNQQMCGSDNIRVDLNNSELMDSIIENIGEVMMHVNRVKYTDRVESAIKGLKLDNKEKYEKYCVLSMLKETQRKCNEDILNCGIYVMLHSCVRLLVDCFNEYNEYMENRGKRNLRFDIFSSVMDVYMKIYENM